MIIGILALQGAFIEHGTVLDRLGINHFEIRQKKDIERSFDALIIPGGESTVISKLLKELDLFNPLYEKITNGLPVFGTCAGMILLSNEVEGGIPCFKCIDIKVKRNAYGRQLGSFHTNSDFSSLGIIPMTFIRAPYITSIGSNATALAAVDNKIVAARQNKILVTAFHPELTDNMEVHKYFIKMING